MDIYARLSSMGLVLPPPPPPAGMYVTLKRVGSLLFTASVLPMKNGAPIYVGKVGAEVTFEQAQEAARLCALNVLSRVDAHLQSLNEVANVVKLNGYVNSAPDFNKHGAVMNAASELLVNLFGKEIGEHVRTSVGVAGLPFDAPLAIEMIFEV